TMNVDGTNFVLDSVVRFNGSVRLTTFVSGTQLTAVIPTSDLTTAGTFSITVFTPSPGGGTSSPFTFTVNKRDATWTTNANSKTYGDADPNPLTTGSGSNFIAADNVTATYSRVAGENASLATYHITAALAPAAVLGNYNITNAGAEFTINKRNATW